jgi:hypothetical protein
MKTQSRKQQHVLSRRAIDKLPAKMFALPAQRRHPIHSIDAAELAWRELQYLDPVDQATARNNICGMYPDLFDLDDEDPNDPNSTEAGSA